MRAAAAGLARPGAAEDIAALLASLVPAGARSAGGVPAHQVMRPCSRLNTRSARARSLG